MRQRPGRTDSAQKNSKNNLVSAEKSVETPFYVADANIGTVQFSKAQSRFFLAGVSELSERYELSAGRWRLPLVLLLLLLLTFAPSR
jgi:hypothetical protein